MKKISFVIAVLLGAVVLFGASRTFAADCFFDVDDNSYVCGDGQTCNDTLGCWCYGSIISSGTTCTLLPGPGTCSNLIDPLSTVYVGQSMTFYNTYSVSFGDVCSDHAETIACTVPGTITPSLNFNYMSCSETTPNGGYCTDVNNCAGKQWCNNIDDGQCGCYGTTINHQEQCTRCALPGGGSLGNGETIVYYQAPVVSLGNACSGAVLSCAAGTLIGTTSYQYSSCSVCGNGTKESNEQCDPADINHEGWGTANPGCTNSCQTSNLGGGGGNGGGGGGGSSTPTCTSASLICTGGVRTKRTGVSCQGGNLGQTCTISTGSSSTTTGTTTGLIGNITGSPYEIELNTAYLYAYSKGITTKPHINNADMMGTLIRKHLAKMIVNFGKNVIGIAANTGINCNFTDMTNEDTEMQYYAIKACQMGLMGLKANGTPDTKFNPNDMVTRAQFGTVLSRIVWGTTYNTTTNPYYARHLLALKIVGIMKDITKPNDVESRGWVMLMMMRTDQYLQSIND